MDHALGASAPRAGSGCSTSFGIRDSDGTAAEAGPDATDGVDLVADGRTPSA
jgi:hypothetical protein